MYRLANGCGDKTVSIFAAAKPMGAPPEDLVVLTTLDTQTIVGALRARHDNRLPYTMCRGVLISINPQQWLPLYTSALRRLYMAGVHRDAHPYVLAARALRNVHIGESHTLVITGESGAGKTEMAKICLEFVSSFATDERSSERIDRILKSGEVLEYLGNAQTIRNNNSSRFGKFLRLFYDGSRQIGASIQTYLLERARIANGNADEGTFRVVYALLDDGGMRDTFALHAVDRSVFGQKNAAQPSSWARFSACLSVAGFDASTSLDIASMIAGAVFLLTRDFANASQIFGVDTSHLAHALSNRRTKVMAETIWSECSNDDVRRRSKALAMAIYARMFDDTVRKLNEFIGGEQLGASLNVLDIFGFEALGTNGLEQLCINYCNEKIQAMFLDDVIVQQQKEYASEGVECSHMDFDTNTGILELCERCVFSCLDEATRMRTSAEGFVQNMSAQRLTGFSVPLVRADRPVFTIAHYAKPVAYDADTMADRNTNDIRNEIVEVMREASNPAVAKLFAGALENPTAGKMWTTSIVGSFCDQMKTLTIDIAATHALYIRCIRPSEDSASLVFDDAVAEEQIAANGILQACKVMRNGFELRMTHQRFAHHFPRYHRRGAISLTAHGGHWGGTMVYMSASCNERVRREEACLRLQARALAVVRRGRRRREAAIDIQRGARARMKRKSSMRRQRAARLVQARVRRHNVRNLARWQHFDEVSLLKARIVELRRELKQKDVWIFRASQILRGRPDLIALAPAVSA
tara:strand:- start:770 stop:3031 length:2262 start_codon:yes stop_codon:yes gene_type:complete